MMGAKVLPTLYKKSSTGALQMWEVGAHPKDVPADPEKPFEKVFVCGEIVTHHGQLGGALQTTSDLVTKGKNLSRANATTPLQQAQAEAQARWTKKKKAGYVESKEAAEAGEVDEVIEGGILPMLAPNKSYPKDDELQKRIEFPCYAQPKLDGMRCIAVIENGKCELWSRTRKRIKTCPHIVEALEKRFAGETLTLDGELYNHDYKDRFEDLISILRGDEPDAEGEYLNAQYHVYDVIEMERGPDGGFLQAGTSFETRLQALVYLMGTATGPIYCVYTQKFATLPNLVAFYENCIEAGYEGAMARNARAPYESGKRSKHLQKMKPFEDREYPIIGAEEGRGKDSGSVGAFVCRAPNGKEFRCRLAATYEKKRAYFLKPETWQGKQLTITLKRLTAEGVPYIPVGKAVRDYE